MAVRSRLGTVAVLIAVGMALVACGEFVRTPVAVLPAAPPDWVTVTDDDGDVRLTLPSAFEQTSTAGGVFAQLAMTEPGVVELEILATGPGSLLDQPAAGESLLDWLERQTLLPSGDLVDRGPTTDRPVTLPVGSGVEVRTSVFPGRPEETDIVMYAIQTTSGTYVLRVMGRPERLESNADDLDLIVRLAEFGGGSTPQSLVPTP